MKKIIRHFVLFEKIINIRLKKEKRITNAKSIEKLLNSNKNKPFNEVSKITKSMKKFKELSLLTYTKNNNKKIEITNLNIIT